MHHVSEGKLVGSCDVCFSWTVFFQEYERLAANLDGARTPLAKKVQSFAPTDSLIPLVEEAEKHADMLSRFATNLSR